jgi:hypothetical protein
MSDKPDLENTPLAVEMMYPGDYWDQDWGAEKRAERETAVDRGEDTEFDAPEHGVT